jgi:hypothetical protein
MFRRDVGMQLQSSAAKRSCLCEKEASVESVSASGTTVTTLAGCPSRPVVSGLQRVVQKGYRGGTDLAADIILLTCCYSQHTRCLPCGPPYSNSESWAEKWTSLHVMLGLGSPLVLDDFLSLGLKQQRLHGPSQLHSKQQPIYSPITYNGIDPVYLIVWHPFHGLKML